MAQSGPSIAARIRLEGAQQVNQQLQALGQAGRPAAWRRAWFWYTTVGLIRQ
jgi:hypothetical protein